MNAAGQLAFSAEVLPPDQPAYQALFSADPDGDLRQLLRLGETLDIAGQDKIVADFRFLAGTGGEDGSYRGFSDDGRLGVWLRFSDQSQALMLISVPEPTGAVILIALASTLLKRRRSTRP